VYTDEAAASARARLFVRRRSSKQRALPQDLAPPATGSPGGTRVGGGGEGASKAGLVDWRASVLLMVVLQTAYRLSVVTADDADLLSAFVDGGGALGEDGGTATPGVRHVTKVVHASPRCG
jgi:hypothetical protein